METNLTSANFDAEIASGVALVDFWAPWCGPCQMMGPVVAELAKEFSGRAKVAKVNVDEEGALAQKFGVMSIPTFKIFKDGKDVATVIGGMPKEKLAAEIEKALA
ncbi:MAG: thioredoxin [Patescibacteria group bacterium]